MGGSVTCAAARATHATKPKPMLSFIGLLDYANNSVYGDLTCSDSLPQLSTATPNAFCNVKPTRDTGLLSPAMWYPVFMRPLAPPATRIGKPSTEWILA